MLPTLYEEFVSRVSMRRALCDFAGDGLPDEPADGQGSEADQGDKQLCSKHRALHQMGSSKIQKAVKRDHDDDQPWIEGDQER